MKILVYQVHTELLSDCPNKNVSSDCLKRLMTSPAIWGPKEDIVPYLMSSCIEGSVAEVGMRPTDEKRMSVNRAQSLGHLRNDL